MDVDTAGFLGERQSGGIIEVGQHEFRAFAGEHPRGRGADAGCGAGDDAGASVQLSHGFLHRGDHSTRRT